MMTDLENRINILIDELNKLKRRVELLETKNDRLQVSFNDLQCDVADFAEVKIKPITKFHPGLYILRLTEHDEMLCAADFSLPTKQIEFTIPEGYLVQEIVLKEKR